MVTVMICGAMGGLTPPLDLGDNRLGQPPRPARTVYLALNIVASVRMRTCDAMVAQFQRLSIISTLALAQPVHVPLVFDGF